MRTTKDPLLLQLLEWCARPGNTQARLAVELGYKTTCTIAAWIFRGRIPDNRRKQVQDFLTQQTERKRKETL